MIGLGRGGSLRSGSVAKKSGGKGSRGTLTLIRRCLFFNVLVRFCLFFNVRFFGEQTTNGLEILGKKWKFYS